jgi:hypothetical protein
MLERATIFVPVLIINMFCTIFELPTLLRAEYCASERSRLMVDGGGGLPPVVVPGSIAEPFEQLSKTEGASTRTVPPSKNFCTTSLLFICEIYLLIYVN